MRATPAFASSPASLLTWDFALRLVASCHAAWLGTVRPDGRPHVAPLWAVVFEGEIWFWTPADSTKGRNLAHGSGAALHVEADDRVAIFEGRASRAAAPSEVVAAYARKYGATGLDERFFWRFEVESALAWRGHLGPAQLDATRFTRST